MSKSLLCATALVFSACTPTSTNPVAATAIAPLDWAALRAVIDGPEAEAWISFHPSGKVVIFDRNTKDWKNHRIFITRLVDGKWTPAEPVPFTAEFEGTAPRFSADGKSVLFASLRPLPGAPPPAANAKKDNNIWRAPWDGRRFGEAVPVTAINSTYHDAEAIEVANGTIYFSSTRSQAINPENKVDIYKAVPTGSGYVISPLDAVNTDHYESTIYVTPDDTLMLFSREHDSSGFGEDDIFLSRSRDGKWSAPIHLKGDVNSPSNEYAPELTPDRRTLLLTTHRSGQAEIIAVPMPAAE